MKALNYLFPAAGLLLLASCSDRAPESPASASDGAIRFSAKTDYASRASDVTTNNLTAFNVYAFTNTPAGPQVFMKDVAVTKTGSTTWTYSPLQYWPANESVSFYAYSPGGWLANQGPLRDVPFTLPTLADQDLVYAVAPNMRGTSMGPQAQVVFNFRHALSKVNVKMSSSNSKLKVVVSNVVLANVMSQANFRFPAANTSQSPSAETVGKWVAWSNPTLIYYHISGTPDDYVTLSTTPTDMSNTGTGLGGAKYLIPQPLSYTDGTSVNDEYITVMCSVYDAATGTKLWPNENTPDANLPDGHATGDGLLKFPCNTSSISSWQPGYHYVYNIVINANDEMSPIQFGTPTVDTYVDVVTTYE